MTIGDENTGTGAMNRVLEIEGSPFESEEKASQIYKEIKNEYGVAGKIFIEKLILEYSNNDYAQLKLYNEEIKKQIEIKAKGKSNSHIAAISIVVLADILAGKYIFNENIEDSINMGADIINRLECSKDIDKTEKCYRYVKNWLLSNHNMFDTYNKCQAYIGPNNENDVISNSSNGRSYGVYENGVYYVLTNIIEDLLYRKGFSYRSILSGLGKRNYIITKNHDNGTIENTIQKKYRGANTRVIAFPVNQLSSTEYEEKVSQGELRLRGIEKEIEIDKKSYKQLMNTNKLIKGKEYSQSYVR